MTIEFGPQTPMAAPATRSVIAAELVTALCAGKATHYRDITAESGTVDCEGWSARLRGIWSTVMLPKSNGGRCAPVARRACEHGTRRVAWHG